MRNQNKTRILKLERTKRDWTQTELGAAANVDPVMICRAERHGYAYPGHLKRLAVALDWKGDPRELLQEVSVN